MAIQAKNSVFRQQLRRADNTAAIIELCQGSMKNGMLFYAYVALKPSKYDAYLKAMTSHKTMNLHRYGTVIKTGVGAAPPEHVKKEMEETFGVEHDFEEKLEMGWKEYLETHTPEGEC